MISPKSIKEIEVALSGRLEEALVKHGFLPLRLKKEPITFRKPGQDDVSVVARVMINGWLNRDYYLTATVGINEPAIGRLFIKAASMDASYRSLLLCGTFVQEHSTKHNELRLKAWPLKDWDNYDSLVVKVVEDVTETIRSLLNQYVSLPGLYKVLRHIEKYPQIRQYEHYLMKLLVPITEYHMGEVQRAKETINENAVQLKKNFSHIHVEKYLAALSFISSKA